MEKGMHSGAIKHLYQRARDLRNKSTHAETMLWGYLKTKPNGHKFRRQHPYSIYILDFYCHSLKLVIEVDGSIHLLEDVKLSLLKQDDLKVLRFQNEAIEKGLENVIKEIENFILKEKDGK